MTSEKVETRPGVFSRNPVSAETLIFRGFLRSKSLEPAATCVNIARTCSGSDTALTQARSRAVHFSWRFNSRSIASRINSAIRLGPTSNSIRCRVCIVIRTLVSTVSDFLLSGGLPMRREISVPGIFVKIVSYCKNNRPRLLTA